MSEMYLFPIQIGKSTMLINAKTLELTDYTSELAKHTFNVKRKDGTLAKKSIRIHRDSKLGLLGSVNFYKNGISEYKIIKADRSELPKVKVEVNGALDAPLFEVNMLDVLEQLDNHKGLVGVFMTDKSTMIIELEKEKIIEHTNETVKDVQLTEKIDTEEEKRYTNNLEVESQLNKIANNFDSREIVNKLLELTIENDKLNKQNRDLTKELELNTERLSSALTICNGIQEECAEVFGVEEIYTHETNTTPYRIDKYFAETLLKTMRQFDRHTFAFDDYMYFNEIKCFPAYSCSKDGKTYEQIVQLKIPGNSIESLIALVSVDGENPVSVIALDTFKKYEVSNEFLRKLDMSYRRYRTSAISEAARTFM